MEETALNGPQDAAGIGTDENGIFELKLYVAGQTPKSKTALENLRRICEEHLRGRYRLEVVDLARNPALARAHKILAIPTLVRSLPMPIQRIIGDLSDEDQVLMGLNVRRIG